MKQLFLKQAAVSVVLGVCVAFAMASGMSPKYTILSITTCPWTDSVFQTTFGCTFNNLTCANPTWDHTDYRCKEDYGGSDNQCCHCKQDYYDCGTWTELQCIRVATPNYYCRGGQFASCGP
jgi:hypothetical protein